MGKLSKEQIHTFIRRRFNLWNKQEKLEGAFTVCLCLNRLGGVWKNLSPMIGSFIARSSFIESCWLFEQMKKEAWLYDVFCHSPLLEIVCSAAPFASLTAMFADIVDKCVPSVSREKFREVAFYGHGDGRVRLPLTCNITTSKNTFLHHAFQEFLTAEYLCFSCKGYAAEKIAGLRSSEGDNMFLRFCCGLGGNAFVDMKRWILDFGFAPSRLGVLEWLAEDTTGQLKHFLLQNWKCERSELFIECSKKGLVEAVSLLLEKGIDPNYCDVFYKRTALMEASHNGHLEVVTLLVKHGANISAIDHYQKNALIAASR